MPKTNKELRRKIRNEKEKFYDQFVSRSFLGRLAMAWNFFDSVENIKHRHQIKSICEARKKCIDQKFYTSSSNEEILKKHPNAQFFSVEEVGLNNVMIQDHCSDRWQEETIAIKELDKKLNARAKLTNAQKQMKQGLKRPHIPTTGIVVKDGL